MCEIAEIVHSGRFAFGRSTDGGWFFAERLRPKRRRSVLTVRQAARLLCCSVRTVYNMRNELGAFTVGKSGVRFNRADILAYKRRGPAAAKQPPARASAAAPFVLRNFTLPESG